MTSGWMCPICFHGRAEPFRCGGPHNGKYTFVDAVEVSDEKPLAEALVKAIEHEWSEMKQQEAQGWREGVVAHDHAWRVLSNLAEEVK